MMNVSCVGGRHTHQYKAHVLDQYGSEISIFYVCVHVTTHSINNSVSTNFNRDYVKVMLSIIIIRVVSILHRIFSTP